MRYVILKLSVYLANIIRLLLKLLVVLLLIVFLSQFVANINKYPTLVKVNNFGQQLVQPLVAQIKLLMPSRYHGIDLSSILLVVVTFFVSSFFYQIKYRSERKLAALNDKKNYEEWRVHAASVLPEEKVAEMDSKFAALQTGQIKPSNRKQILKEFAALKTQLDNMGQQLAFLAIDVADSTGMKKDEDKS